MHALDRLFTWVLDNDGAITGEHGVGLAKKRWIRQALGEVSFESTRRSNTRSIPRASSIPASSSETPRRGGLRSALSHEEPMRSADPALHSPSMDMGSPPLLATLTLPAPRPDGGTPRPPWRIAKRGEK